jgi:hypothetical protein
MTAKNQVQNPGRCIVAMADRPDRGDMSDRPEREPLRYAQAEQVLGTWKYPLR